MAKRGTRKLGLFRRVYSPLNHLVSATRNVGRTVFKRSGRIVDEGLGAIQNTGISLTGHANSAIRNLTRSRRARRGGRRNNMNMNMNMNARRGSRKSSRRNNMNMKMNGRRGSRNRK